MKKTITSVAALTIRRPSVSILLLGVISMTRADYNIQEGFGQVPLARWLVESMGFRSGSSSENALNTAGRA
jgi:hypothetical protein